MQKPTVVPAASLRPFQDYALDRAQQAKVKGGQGDFIIIDDVNGF